MIKDTTGSEVTYWPISNLIEGQITGVMEFVIDTPVAGVLKTSSDGRLRVWARALGEPSYVNISVTGLNLSGYGAVETTFQMYAEALAPIEGFERVPLTVTAAVSSAAGWAN